MGSPVTIKDVARLAGVAVGTVSNHLNGTVGVAPETRSRIERAIRQLGYQVHLGARSLRSQRTHCAGLVLPNISNPFFSEIARAIGQSLWAEGIQTFLCDSAGDPALERKHVESLAQRRVDGILMIRAGARSAVPREILQLGIPVVYVDRGVRGEHVVVTDDCRGGELAAMHLAELGHRRIGLLVGQSVTGNGRQRVRGFCSELRRYGLSVDPAHVVEGPPTAELGHEVARIMKRSVRPTAFFATYDVVAVGAWHRLLELGVRIPEDVSLVGYDDIEMGRLLIPPLTTVSRDKEAMGRRAAQVLLGLLKGDRVPRETVIQPELIVRGSSGPATGLVVKRQRTAVPREVSHG